MKATASDRRERLRAMLADLKMPGALEAMDGVLAQVDSGAVTAGEAIEQVLGAQIALCNNRRLQAAMRSSRLPAVRLEFVVRPPLGAGPSPGSGRPNGHCSVRHGPPCVRQRRSTACGPSTTRGCVPRCRRPGSRQVFVQDHGHSRTAYGRDLLAASCRSGAPRMGGTGAATASPHTMAAIGIHPDTHGACRAAPRAS